METKFNKIKKYFNYFIGDKVLVFCMKAAIFMIFCLVYNAFCYSTKISDFQIDFSFVRKCFAIETISAFVYTYIGHILTLFFMERKGYKEILIFCLPLTFLAVILATCAGGAITTLVMLFLYIVWRTMKSGKGITIFSTCFYFIVLFLIQYVFYEINYVLAGINYNIIDSFYLKMFLDFDYFIFISFIIIIKNLVVRK